MRAVTGSVASSRPISLSKAAAVLARFTAGQTAARPDVSAFVRRASAAFDELVIFHRANRSARNNSREVVGKKTTNGVGFHGKDANFVEEEDGNRFGSHGEKKEHHKGKGFMEERSSLAVKEGKLLHSDGVELQEGRKGRRKKMKPEVEEEILHRNPTQYSFAGAEFLEMEDQKDHHQKKRRKRERAEEVKLMQKLHC